MHLVIGNRIANRLSMEQRTDFLLGGIAPDAASEKDTTHFFKGDVEDNSRSIDYEAFLNKYNSEAHEPYVQGYYTHLVADHLWLTGFYLPWLKNRMEKKELAPLYYKDFEILNGKLLEFYGYRNEIKKTLESPATIFDLDEVNATDVQAFKTCVLPDLEYEQETLHLPLQVFTFNQIIGYIETTVDQVTRDMGTGKLSHVTSQTW